MTSKFLRGFLFTLLLSFPFSAAEAATLSTEANPTEATSKQGVTVQGSADPASLNEEVLRLYKASKFDEAISIAKRIVKMREKQLPVDDSLLGESLGNLAALYLAKSSFDDAVPHLKRALSLYEKSPAGNEFPMAKTLEHLANVFRSKGETAKAERLYLQALSIKQKALPPYDEEILYSLNNLTHFYAREKQYAQAEATLQRLITMKEQQLGNSDAQVARLLERMACLMHANQEKVEAEKVEARANHILYGPLLTDAKPVSLPEEVFSCKLIINPRPDLRSVGGRPPAGRFAMVVSVETDEAGNVTTARYIGGPPVYKSIAEKTALKAKLRPTIVDGRPVRVEGVISHEFRVEERRIAVPVGSP